MLISPSAESIFRDFIVDGAPLSGPYEPKKSEVRAWGRSVETVVEAVATAAAVFDTRANLFATLTYAANTLAWVVSDSTAAYNGIYRKSGASGAGSWARVADLPYSFIIATDVGAGTANAIQATSTIAISESALVILNIFETSGAGPVSVAFNGGPALAVKTASGADPATGGLVAGMRVLGVVSGASFRLVSDQASSAIQAAAEAAKVAAEAAAAAAAASAASITLPSVSLPADVGKRLEVGASGYELVAQPSTQLKNANFTLAAADNERFFLLNGNFTISSAAAAVLGSKFRTRLRNIGSGIVTVDPNGTELIDGKLTVRILPGQSCELVSDASALYTIGLANELSVLFSASAQSELVIPLPDGYASHDLQLHGLVPATAAQLHMLFSVDGGVNYLNSSIAYSWTIVDAQATPTVFSAGSNYADTKLQLTGTQRASTVSAITGVVRIENPLAGSFNKRASWNLTYSDATPLMQRISGAGEVPSTGRITHVKLFHPGSVNISSGSVTLRSRA